MKIAAVVVTCNRLTLLPRALKSIKNQIRKPDFIIVVSNSNDDNYEKEINICADFEINITKNLRTATYTGALNTAVEEIIKECGISEELYFASLDDDDEWLSDYLQEIENNNTKNFDLLIGYLLRKSATENHLQILPHELSIRNFLTGNPGICGSNTFIKLTTLLRAGSFDESAAATADRDFLVRVFQLNPTYKIVNKHLVTQHTDNDRPRETTSGEKKKKSLLVFYYKYNHLMNEEDKELFFARANKLFGVSKIEFENIPSNIQATIQKEITFENKGNYEFVIGFIAGNESIAERVVNEIVNKKIAVDLVIIVDDTPKGKSLKNCEKVFYKHNIAYKIIKHIEWQSNLASGHYGAIFKKFSSINSIPLGRTILHHHLFTETMEMENPVYWIIDDDIKYSATTFTELNDQSINIFEIINENIGKVDTIIGAISCDPPVPTLCCIRTQLVDFLYSVQANSSINADYLKIKSKPDYYYDLSDLHSDHLETPIYHTDTSENDLITILSGKALSRIAIQKELKAEEKIISKRGANTIVLNRDVLHYYPVVNIEVKNKFARRGDLTWALLNQVVSNKKFIEHSFSLDHNRPISKFEISKELEKSAYDIIGYAFNKSILKVINQIKSETNPYRPKDIFEKLIEEKFYQDFLKTYNFFLRKRETRFLMNYYRIIGLASLLSNKYEAAKEFQEQLVKLEELNGFTNLIKEAQNKITLKKFFDEFLITIWNYDNSITEISVDEKKHQQIVETYFKIKKPIRILGKGHEGIALTDNIWVYKSLYDIPQKAWIFLKEISANFDQCNLLEKLEFFETSENKMIRYPFHPFKKLEFVNEENIISFLKFCKKTGFVFTNINAQNSIQTISGQMKFIDYGKSFEPYTEEKFKNAVKRSYLLYKFPLMDNDNFSKLTKKINSGEIPNEIVGWEEFYNQIN